MRTSSTFEGTGFQMIGIVGAGVSGLALGAFLAQRGVAFRIWEAGDRPGGVIRSSRVEGRILEQGPQRMRATPSVRSLVAWSQVDGEIRVPESLPLRVYRDGALRLAPRDAGGFVRTDLLSLPAKLRVLCEPLTGGVRAGESVADYLTRKLGHEAYRNLAGPLLGGLYGSDPADMPARYTVDALLRDAGIGRSLVWPVLKRSLAPARGGKGTTPAVSFREGLQSWTDALARRLGDPLQLSSPVTAMEPAGSGWILSVGRDEDVRVDAVVLTVPAPEAGRLLAPEAPDAAARLRRLTYNRIVMVHLLADGPLDALGYQVAFGERLRTRGVTWNAAALGRDGVYTAFLGGSRDPELPELPDDRIGEIAADEFEQVTGCAARVVSVGRTLVPAWDRSWRAMDGLELPANLHLCTNYESRVGIPGRVRRAREVADLLGSGRAASAN